MVFGFGLSLTAINTLSAVQRAINILKSAGPGAWYDPSDLTTLFQDSAGTTPVTAVEQPVGLMLDKSQGLVLGAEKVNSSVGALGDAYLIRGTSVAAGGGYYTVTGNTGLVSAVAAPEGFVTFGKSYRVTLDVSAVSGGSVALSLSTDQGAGLLTAFLTATTPGTYSATVTTDALSRDCITALCGTSGQSITFKVSVKELPGNHLIQPTATSRPTLSSRYNLLTKTEQFDDAAWPKTNLTVTANSTVAPDGTTTAEKIVENTTASVSHYIRQIIYAAVASGTVVTYSLYAKAGERTRFGMIDGYVNKGSFFDLSNGTVVGNFVGAPTSSSITSVGNGWYLCTITVTTSGANTDLEVYPVQSGTTYIYTGDGTSGIYVWGASLTTAADASLPYQRVNTDYDYDYDFAKFPPFLRFDGVDDSLYTSAIDFTSTDKMTVFAGVHKASDAAAGVVSELSGDANSNNGSFFLLAPRSGSDNAFAFASKGTTLVLAPGNSTPAPTTKVVSVVGDISSPKVEIRLNGVSQYSTAGSQGTGNYGNHVLYIGRRANASLPFSGRIYQLAIKGKALSAGEIATVEALINARTKAF